MALDVVIKGAGDRGGAEVAVTRDQELLVSVAPYPPFEEQRVHPFSQFLTLDGTADGDNDMGVNGAVTNQEFYVPADEDEDRYVTRLSILMAYGTTGQPFQFADSTALTNGIRLFYDSVKGEREIFNIQSNQDFFRVATSQIRTNWEVRGVGATNDYGYFIDFDLTRLQPPFGIKLDRGKDQRLTAVVRDDASNADTLNILAFGFDRFAR